MTAILNPADFSPKSSVEILRLRFLVLIPIHSDSVAFRWGLVTCSSENVSWRIVPTLV